jgi:hypothetical protein
VSDGQKPPLSHELDDELPESYDDELLHELDDESENDAVYMAVFAAVVSGVVEPGRDEEPVFFWRALLPCFFSVIPASFPPGSGTSPDLRKYRGFPANSYLFSGSLAYSRSESSWSRGGDGVRPSGRPCRAATFLPRRRWPLIHFVRQAR